MNSELLVPPVKPEVVLSPGEPVQTVVSLPREEQDEEDPAMKPQSVLNRVKMFENKRSVSVDRAKETGDLPGVRVCHFLPIIILYVPLHYK